MNIAILYSTTSRPLTNPYMRIVHIGNGKIWNPTQKELQATPAWADTVITMTENSYIKGFPIEMPKDDLDESGEYHLLVYDNETPADTDEVKWGRQANWSGSGVIGSLLKV